MPIKYIQGDATRPQLVAGENALIVHISNDRGGWGRGFVVSLSQRWPQPEAAYRLWYRTGSNDKGEPFRLGNIQCVEVEPGLYVVNMIAQSGYHTRRHRAGVVAMEALATCLAKVAQLARKMNAGIFMPRIGTGLGGSSWVAIEPLISKHLAGLSVTVYDYPS